MSNSREIGFSKERNDLIDEIANRVLIDEVLKKRGHTGVNDANLAICDMLSDDKDERIRATKELTQLILYVIRDELQSRGFQYMYKILGLKCGSNSKISRLMRIVDNRISGMKMSRREDMSLSDE